MNRLRTTEYAVLFMTLGIRMHMTALSCRLIYTVNAYKKTKNFRSIEPSTYLLNFHNGLIIHIAIDSQTTTRLFLSTEVGRTVIGTVIILIPNCSQNVRQF